jgi:hypothetical protein
MQQCQWSNCEKQIAQGCNVASFLEYIKKNQSKPKQLEAAILMHETKSFIACTKITIEQKEVGGVERH